ncbi:MULTISPECIES: YihY/virulence factor BrkB family protein [unclassified Haladaptatus]|uniref:YihY/virulence factor BrkB family protein n=1 Tax=unclassified Haladaptatus TaxID=2622732 RepID=UPI0023E83661|nr:MULTISPECIES: YihY/virulence factor BrkB family protein [unclassified Haladaptatus]
MNARLDRPVTVARAVVHEIRTENITFMAGSIAYHAFVSLLPLLLLVTAVISTVGNQTLQDGFLRLMQAVLTENAGNILVEELQTGGASTSVSILGLVVLIWGTLRIFRGLDTAFSDIYETEAENTFFDSLSDGLIVLAAVAVALLVGGWVETSLPEFGSPAVRWVVQRGILVVGLSLAFFPMFYIFPDTDVSVREVLPGVTFAAVGLALFETLFRFYTEFRTDGEGGVVAGIIILLTWLYFSGLVILVGAAINAVLSNRSKDVNIQPVIGGIEPLAKQSDIERSTLTERLSELEELLEREDVEEITVTVDGEQITFPRPLTVTTDTERSPLHLGDGTVGVEVWWSPRED